MIIPRIHAFFAVSWRLSWSPFFSFHSLRHPWFLRVPHVFAPVRPFSSPISAIYDIYDIYDTSRPLTDQRCDGNGAGHQARRHGPESEPATPVSLDQLASHAIPRGHYRQPRRRIRGNHHSTTNTAPRVLQ